MIRSSVTANAAEHPIDAGSRARRQVTLADCDTLGLHPSLPWFTDNHQVRGQASQFVTCDANRRKDRSEQSQAKGRLLDERERTVILQPFVRRLEDSPRQLVREIQER